MFEDAHAQRDAERAALETQVHAHPDDADLREQLLFAYCGDARILAHPTRIETIVWLIRHRPRTALLRSPCAHIAPYPAREAFEAIEQAWRMQYDADPLDPEIARGYAAFVAHTPERALAILHTVVAAEPAEADVWLDMGRISGSIDDRLRFFQTARRRGCTRPNLLSWLAAAALDADDLETAAEYGEELLDRSRQAREVHGDALDWPERGAALRERARRAGGDAGAAQTLMRAQSQHAHDKHWAHTTLGEVALRSGYADEALEHLRQSGEVAGDARLASYGPSLRLAAALAFEGFHAEVSAFLTACSRFWNDERLDAWIAALHDGIEPDGWAELVPDRDPSPEQQEAIDRIAPAERDAIDATLLSNARRSWRKIAKVIADTMDHERREGIPDVFYASRVRELIRRGMLEVQGNPRRMRFGEVRLPGER